MKDNSTLIAIVLDRSGSMNSVKTDVIGGFNKLIEAHKQLPGECLVTLVQFDDQYELNYNALPITEVPELSEKTYEPRGWTRLLDAIGRVINDVGAKLAAKPEHERPSKVLLVVMTDGHENSSKEFNARRVRDMIKHQRDKYSWEFAFHGCDESALNDAVGLYGFQAQNTIKNVGGSSGTQSAFRDATICSTNYRSMGSYSVTPSK